MGTSFESFTFPIKELPARWNVSISGNCYTTLIHRLISEVQEGECPNKLDPQNPLYVEETGPNVIVNGFSERLRVSHSQRIRPNSESLGMEGRAPSAYTSILRESRQRRQSPSFFKAVNRNVGILPVSSGRGNTITQ
ncbi:hypothetical protein U0070_007750 [Myodes glareolus]|uniref:Uncharacterized protein n=1 Tax=Myodes glareolus TaxID=447135 RepID=A0AAW0HZZ8_MYOGA